MAAASGPRRRKRKAQPSLSRWERQTGHRLRYWIWSRPLLHEDHMLNAQIEILLVEDDPDDLDLALRALNEAHVGNQIQIARDGEEALDFLLCRGRNSERDGRQQPKLVLLDLKLPKVDGLEVLKQIKLNEPTKAVPV